MKFYKAFVTQNDNETLLITPINSEDDNYLGDITWSFDVNRLKGESIGAFGGNVYMPFNSINFTSQSSGAQVYMNGGVNDPDSVGLFANVVGGGAELNHFLNNYFEIITD